MDSGFQEEFKEIEINVSHQYWPTLLLMPSLQ